MCLQLPCLLYATPFLGSGLSIYGQQQPSPDSTGQAAWLVEHPQAALLLPLSPEAPKDPTALTGPAARGPSAEGTCSGRHPEWTRGAYSVNRLNLPNSVFSLFQSLWTKAQGLRLGGEGSPAHSLLPTSTSPCSPPPPWGRGGDTSWTPGGWLGPDWCVDSTLLSS